MQLLRTERINSLPHPSLRGSGADPSCSLHRQQASEEHSTLPLPTGRVKRISTGISQCCACTIRGDTGGPATAFSVETPPLRAAACELDVGAMERAPRPLSQDEVTQQS